MKYKFNKVRLLFAAIFLFVSIAMFCGLAVILSTWNAHKDSYVAVQAVITDIKTERNRSKTWHTVTIAYEFEGVPYERGLGYYSSDMRRGDTVEILCDPADPLVTLTSPRSGVGIYGFLGAVTGIVGVVALVIELRKRNAAMRLIRAGEFVYAEFEREDFANVRVNGVPYSLATFVYIDPYGVRYEFVSEAYHPEKYPYGDGRPVRVYVDLRDPKRYYITADQNDPL